MMLAERTLAFAAQAPSLQTRKALGASLLSLIEGVGANQFACGYLRREGGNVTIERSISNTSRLWQQFYLQRGYEATDPVLQNVMRGGSYGFWEEITEGLLLNRGSREVMSAAREFNMRDGFTKRIALDNGGTAVMMVAGEELDRSDHARAALRMTLDVFANEGARMLKFGERPEDESHAGRRGLSKTQYKVLQMRSEGLSNKQVAQEMARHEKTVECHVTEILRRLEARNMIDAIRIANKLKLRA